MNTVSLPGSAPDADEVEADLARILREQYATEIADHSLPPHEAAAFDERSRAAIKSVLATTRPPTTRSLRNAGPAGWVAAAAAVAAVVLVLTVGTFGHTTPTAYAATPPVLDIAGTNAARYPLVGTPAGDELRRLAGIAAHTPARVQGINSGVQTGPDGNRDAQHLELSSWWLETSPAGTGDRRVVPTDVRRYILPSGAIRLITRRGNPMTDRTETTPATGPVTSREAIPAGADKAGIDPAKLPLDPGKLRKRLVGDPHECAGEMGYCLSNAIQKLALTHVLSPRLNAALLRSMVGAGDLRYAGRAIDRAGHPSEVFVVDEPGHDRQRLLLFDADTGAFNGDETVLVKDDKELGVRAPAVIGFDAVVTREWIPAGAAPHFK